MFTLSLSLSLYILLLLRAESWPCLLQWITGLEVSRANRVLLTIAESGVIIVDYMVSRPVFYSWHEAI